MNQLRRKALKKGENYEKKMIKSKYFNWLLCLLENWILVGRLFKEGHWLIADFTHMRLDEGPLWKKEKGKWERRTWEVMGAGRKEEQLKQYRYSAFYPWTLFPDENYAIPHKGRGVLGMANKGRHSNGSQFYITLQPVPYLDKKCVAFGYVCTSLHLLQHIGHPSSAGHGVHVIPTATATWMSLARESMDKSHLMYLLTPFFPFLCSGLAWSSWKTQW